MDTNDIVCCCVLIITLIIYITHWILDEKRIKKQINSLERDPHSGIIRVGNQVEDLFRTMTLEEWDRFIKEENDPHIQTYNVFTKVKGIQKFDYYELANFLRDHKYHISWLDLFSCVEVPIKILKEFKEDIEHIAPDYIIFSQKLPEDFIRRYIDINVQLTNILRYQQVSEKFMEEYMHRFTKQDWIFVAGYQKLSEEFILKHKKKLDGKIVILRQNHLSREFILNLYKKINWVEISMERLDEDFMRKWKDKLYWTYICSGNNGNMSDDFIMEMKDYVEWKDLWMSRIMSKRIKEEAKKQLGDWINGNS